MQGFAGSNIILKDTITYAAAPSAQIELSAIQHNPLIPQMAKVLVTGAAGFIGFHASSRLLDSGNDVVGLDNLNAYYDVTLKQARLAQLRERAGFTFVHADIADRSAVERLFSEERFEKVLHLAAQAGVRYSITNPHAYVDSNVSGFLNILEGCRHNRVGHLVYASSSSVYGANTQMPFSVHQNVDHPISLYAATKKANELMAHTYSHLYSLPTTGLRFFTVYGPWGRPDMAFFLFTRAILEGMPLNVFNHGKMRRDFTYISDIVEGVVQALETVARPNGKWSSDSPDPSSSSAPYRLYNIGNHQPVELMHVIRLLEKQLGKSAELNMLDMQPGDVPMTYADIDDLRRDLGVQPVTSIEKGIEQFVEWYLDYYRRPE